MRRTSLALKIVPIFAALQGSSGIPRLIGRNRIEHSGGIWLLQGTWVSEVLRSSRCRACSMSERIF